MSRHRPEYLDLCAAWVLGCIDEGDRLELDQHLAQGCDVCEAEIARLDEGKRLLAASALPVAPAARVRAATLARVRAAMDEVPREEGRAVPESRRGAVVDLRPRPARRWPTWALAAACVAIAAGAAGLWHSREGFREELTIARRSVADLERSLETERGWARLFASHDLRAVEFSATPEAIPPLRARGIWDPGTRRAVLVFELPTTPSDRDYQLWGLHPSGPASLGLIRADASGRFVVRLENAGDPATLQAFAVSLEPTGGSPKPTPTGPVILVGRFGT